MKPFVNIVSNIITYVVVSPIYISVFNISIATGYSCIPIISIIGAIISGGNIFFILSVPILYITKDIITYIAP